MGSLWYLISCWTACSDSLPTVIKICGGGNDLLPPGSVTCSFPAYLLISISTGWIHAVIEFRHVSIQFSGIGNSRSGRVWVDGKNAEFTCCSGLPSFVWDYVFPASKTATCGLICAVCCTTDLCGPRRAATCEQKHKNNWIVEIVGALLILMMFVSNIQVCNWL